MFASHPFADAGRKRGRDEDDDAGNGGMLSFGEHRTKRLQCLPLRSPPSTRKWTAPTFPPFSSFQSFQTQAQQPDTITPADSDSEEAASQQPRSHFSPWSSSPALPQPTPTHHQQGASFSSEADDDMMVDASSPPPMTVGAPSIHIHDQHLSPGLFHAEAPSSNIAGRMPTPIQPNFASQIRGSSWLGPGPALQHPNGVANMGHQHDGFSALDDRCIPRSMDAGAAADWHAVQNRRLPSPISEGEDLCSPTTGASTVTSPQMVLDGSFTSQLSAKLQLHETAHHHHHHHHQQPLQQHVFDHHQAFAAHTREDHGMMDVEEVPEEDDTHGVILAADDLALDAATTLPLVQTTSAPAEIEISSAPATPSPGRSRGHMRSRHTVNSWTWQPGMKKSFSIGYRADCEKCRLKVPGHFNHIIIS